jgi:hypothetical protein
MLLQRVSAKSRAASMANFRASAIRSGYRTGACAVEMTHLRKITTRLTSCRGAALYVNNGHPFQGCGFVMYFNPQSDCAALSLQALCIPPFNLAKRLACRSGWIR